MASDTIHIEVDGTVKAEAEEALAGLGLTVSDAVRLLLARVAAEKVLPFERLSGNGTKPQATDAPESKEPTNSDRQEEEWADELARLIAAGVIIPPKDSNPIDWDAFWALPMPTCSDEAVKDAVAWVKGEL